MRPSHNLPQVYLCRDVVDMRKSINGLSVLVEGVLLLNPFESHLFAFCNRRRDKIKILGWEGNGFVLWYKRLEKERFFWPREMEEDVITLTGQELNWLLDGLDISDLKPHKKLSYLTVL
ncbi:MAG: IS66 family insertion sequence element accessory protein TnpB [Planctomycetota bacterium]